MQKKYMRGMGYFDAVTELTAYVIYFCQNLTRYTLGFFYGSFNDALDAFCIGSYFALLRLSGNSTEGWSRSTSSDGLE